MSSKEKSSSLRRTLHAYTSIQPLGKSETYIVLGWYTFENSVDRLERDAEVSHAQQRFCTTGFRKLKILETGSVPSRLPWDPRKIYINRIEKEG